DLAGHAGHVEVGVAQARGRHLDQDLPRARLGHRHLGELRRLPPAHEPVGGHRPPHGGPSCRGRRVTASGRAGPGPALATALQATVKRAASAPGHKCLDTRRTCWRTPRMRLGVSLAQTGRLADPASVRSAATAAEQVGYASVWVHDRLDGGRAGDASLDPLCALSRSEEHTSELQSRENLVCRLLLEKKKYQHKYPFLPDNLRLKSK